MHTKSVILRCLVIVLVLLVLQTCGRRVNTVSNKVKRKVADLSDVRNNYLLDRNNFTNTNNGDGRGFLHGGIFTLGKVLNFFPVGGERECQPSGYNKARAGICLNPYDCRQRDGRAAGDCAHGLGVCCVFEVTCGGVAANNLTYFSSPNFPELWTGARKCSLTIEKAFAGIVQLRIDFVHFTIGQPNRTTGECDEDVLVLGEGNNNFTLCGQNHGQHIYFNLPSKSETREAGELPSSKSTRLSIVMRGSDMPRLWLLRLAQLPLAHSAPHNCLQYYTDSNGTIKSFNYASNGRHLASQDYRSCVRRNVGNCGVRYTPCDARSFRIGAPGDRVMDPAELDLGPGPTTAPVSTTTPFTTTVAALATMDEQIDGPQNGTTEAPELIAQETQEDEMEGSGADPNIASPIQSRPAPKKPRWSLLSVIWSYIWPWQARSWRWSPYAQHYNFRPELTREDELTGEDDMTERDKITNSFRFYGYGNFGAGLKGFGRQRCSDRVTIPCENEYFVSSSVYGTGVCDPHHCGSTFCPGVSFENCRVETSITPFAVSFHFGPPTLKRSPEDNIGVCLKYTQLPCDS